MNLGAARGTGRRIVASLQREAAALASGRGTMRWRGHKVHDPSRPNVLIVAPGASRSGVPILTVSLAAQLSAGFNVVVLCLRPGPLVEALREVAVEVHVMTRGVEAMGLHRRAIALLCRRLGFAFAILNSAATCDTSEPISASGVPTIALIHEFLVYLPHRDRVRRMIDRAAAVVFSARATFEDAVAAIGPIPSEKVLLQPQGRYALPGGRDEGALACADRQKIEDALWPAGQRPDLTVLGVGTVEYRKGVDLFITCAANVRARLPGRDLRFVWVGRGFDPDRDLGYSAYLSDQLRRSGVADIVQILHETPEVLHAYALADVYLLTSRLDPFPGSAVDALFAAVPVVGFDKASGIAELLESGGLGEACVARYLDVEDLASKVAALAASEEDRVALGQRSRELAEARLSMEDYVERIVALVLEGGALPAGAVAGGRAALTP